MDGVRRCLAAATAGLVGVAAGVANATTPGGLTYAVARDIVGKVSDSTLATGGNPMYLATDPFYRGVDGEPASITSFGLSFGPNFGDIDDNLGFLDTALNPATVPEPATWATMLVGFGVLGGEARKRRPLAA